MVLGLTLVLRSFLGRALRTSRSSTRSSAHQRRRHTATRTVATTTTHIGALHDARTRRRHQSTHERQCCGPNSPAKDSQKQTCNDCTPKSSSQVRNHHRTSETPRSISYFRAETRHRHPTTEPSVRSPSGTNSSARLSEVLQPTQDAHQIG